MANPQLSLQVWGAADYDWLNSAAGNPPTEIQDKFEAWLIAIGTNPSVVAQAGSLPQLHKGVASSIDPTYIGWTASFPQNNTATMYCSMHSRSTSGGRYHVGYEWNDTSDNGGYGEWPGEANQSSAGNQVAWSDDFSMYTSAYQMSFLVLEDTTDGEEFFGVSSWLDGENLSTRSWNWLIWRDRDGGWVFMPNDSSYSSVIGMGWDFKQGKPMSLTERKDPQSNYMLEHLVLVRNFSNTLDLVTLDDQLWWAPKNEKLVSWNSSSNTYPGTWAAIDGTEEVYLKYGMSPVWVRYNPVGQY